jgi:hypothetical protein
MRQAKFIEQFSAVTFPWRAPLSAKILKNLHSRNVIAVGRNVLTNSRELSPSRETDSLATTKEFPNTLWTVHYMLTRAYHWFLI